MKAAGATVSVIIPVFRDHDRLRLCLQGLLNQDYEDGFEVIVVNNEASAVHVPVPSGLNVRVVHEPRPGSYHARNAGIAVARGPYLAFTDSDCIPDKRWISAGVQCFDGHPRCGLVGGRIDVFARPRPGFWERYDKLRAFRQRSYVEEQCFAATANMVTHRAVVARVGAFKGELKSGGDKEWGRRVRRGGYSIRYCDQAVVMHPARSTYAEHVQKVRRTAAGSRDRNPGWGGCLVSCLRSLPPRIGEMKTMWREGRSESSGPLVMGLIACAVFMRWRTALERIRLQVARSQSPRT